MKKTLFFFASTMLISMCLFPLFSQEVTPLGSFIYRYPLKLPPGTNGMGPELALVYDSFSGNGILGMGFSITGLSVITRDSSYGIKFDNTDHYIYDGQRLIYDSENDLYHTERESFLRIKAVWSAGDIDYWVVTQKNGTISYFGRAPNCNDTSDGRIEAVGKNGKALAWALNKVKDISGNYNLMEYSKDPINGDYYPIRITYTMNDPLAKNAVVEFSYEPRLDHFPMYVQSKVDTDKRMAWITVKMGGNLLRKYKLEYAYSNLTARSRLTSIQEYGNDGTTPPCPDVGIYIPGAQEKTLPKTEFGWHDSGSGWEGYPMILNVGPRDGYVDGNRYPLFSGDFNGDGKSDFARIFDAGLLVQLSNGSGWEGYPMILNVGPRDGYVDGNRYPLFGGDFNGDGKSDFARIFDAGLLVQLSNGSGWEGYPMILNVGPLDGYVDGNRYPLFGGDFNGDGRTDFARVFDAGLIVKLSTGNGWVDYPWIMNVGPLDGYVDGNRYPLFFGDFNGDGKTDFARVFDAGLIVKLSTGNGWVDYPWIMNVGPLDGYVDGNRYPLFFGDFNGDGKTDFARIFDAGLIVKLSTGSGWVDYQWIGSVGPRDGYVDGNRYPLFGGDFNGDGKSDFARIFDAGLIVKLSTGSGWVDYQWIGSVGPRDGYVDGNRYPLFSGDFNGDGKSDFARIFDAGLLVKLSMSSSGAGACDLLVSVSNYNCNGGSVTIVYTPATQVSGAIDPSASAYPVMANSIPRCLVTLLACDDGFGNLATSTYNYCNGKYLNGFPWLREDLGFASTTAKVDSTGAFVTTFYRQDPPFAGLVDKADTYGSDGKLYKETRNFYSSQSSAASTFVYKTAMEEWNYNGETSADVYREEYTYDAYGNVTLTDNKGNVANPYDDIQTSITYAKNTSAWIFATSTKITSAYDLSDTWGIAAKEQYFYDNLPSGQVSAGLLTSEVLGYGGTAITQTFGYDDYGNLIWTRDGRANSGEYTTHTTDITIDPTYHRYVTAKTNALGQTTSTTFDYLMRPTSTTDPNNKISSVVYDVFSRQVAIISPLDTLENPTTKTFYMDGQFPSGIHTQRNAGATTIDSYVYIDGFGRTIQSKQQDANGGWITIDTYYDGAGRAFKTSVPYLTSTPAFTTRDSSQKCVLLQFDPIGRVCQMTSTDGTASQTLYGKKSVTTIDENGHVTVQTTIDRRTSTGSRYSGTYPSQQIYSTTTVKKAFNGERITDQNGNMTQTTLDALGRKVAYSDPDMGTWSYSYDADGNVVSQTDAKGQTRTFQYDLLNRIIKKQYPDSTSVNYVFDEESHGDGPIGHLTTVSFKSGIARYSYDARGRVSSHTRILNGSSRTISYTYDPLDRVVNETYPDGEIVNSSYDGSGNLVSLTGAGSYSYVSGISYAPNGKIIQMTYGNGTKTQYDYYDDSTEPDQSAGTTFSYRLRGISITHGPTTTIANTTYQYDKKDNVMVKDFTDGTQYYTEQFSYDEYDRLVSAQSTDLYGSKNYQYDELDNIRSKDGRTYTYGTSKPHAVLSDGTYTYTYDANGNMVGRSDGRTITYDYENRVVSISTAGSYRYDADGERTVKTEGGTTTYYFFQDYEETRQSGQPTVKVKYYFMNGIRIAERSSVDGLLFYHADHLGSAVRITDACAAIVKSLAYDPFGADAYSSGSPTITHKYTDQIQDSGSGLYYYGARYYDPVLGRFISPDTVLDGLNRYAYCGNNPVKYADPTGHIFGIDDMIFCVIVGVLAGTYVGGSIANDNWNPVQWNWSSPNTWFGMAFGGTAGGLIGAGVGMLASGQYALTGSLSSSGLSINIVGNTTAQAAAWSSNWVAAFLGIGSSGGCATVGISHKVGGVSSEASDSQPPTLIKYSGQAENEYNGFGPLSYLDLFENASYNYDDNYRQNFFSNGSVGPLYYAEAYTSPLEILGRALPGNIPDNKLDWAFEFLNNAAKKSTWIDFEAWIMTNRKGDALMEWGLLTTRNMVSDSIEGGGRPMTHDLYPVTDRNHALQLLIMNPRLMFDLLIQTRLYRPKERAW